MPTKFDFTTDRGIPMRIVLLEPGEENPNFPHATSAERIVEFYDMRYNGEHFTPDGQFTAARYYLRTLLEDSDRLKANGLDLYGGIPDWTMDGPTYAGAMLGVMEQRFLNLVLQEQ